MRNPILLLVEDSEDDVFFFRRTFRKAGVELDVHHVANGQAAIEFLRDAAASNSLPSIVFLDLKMPVLNGFDVLIWMKKQSFMAPIAVLALSGSDQQKDFDRAIQLGAVEYLVKPVAVADLQRVLQKSGVSP
jgi:CheY-like chemotaxis protein